MTGSNIKKNNISNSNTNSNSNSNNMKRSTSYNEIETLVTLDTQHTKKMGNISSKSNKGQFRRRSISYDKKAVPSVVETVVAERRTIGPGTVLLLPDEHKNNKNNNNTQANNNNPNAPNSNRNIRRHTTATGPTDIIDIVSSINMSINMDYANNMPDAEKNKSRSRSRGGTNINRRPSREERRIKGFEQTESARVFGSTTDKLLMRLDSTSSLGVSGNTFRQVNESKAAVAAVTAAAAAKNKNATPSRKQQQQSNNSDLHKMSIQQLKLELRKEHGIHIGEGVFDKSDLINACSQARRVDLSLRGYTNTMQHSNSNGSSSNNGNSNRQHQQSQQSQHHTRRRKTGDAISSTSNMFDKNKRQQQRQQPQRGKSLDSAKLAASTAATSNNNFSTPVRSPARRLTTSRRPTSGSNASGVGLAGEVGNSGLSDISNPQGAGRRQQHQQQSYHHIVKTNTNDGPPQSTPSSPPRPPSSRGSFQLVKTNFGDDDDDDDDDNDKKFGGSSNKRRTTQQSAYSSSSLKRGYSNPRISRSRSNSSGSNGSISLESSIRSAEMEMEVAVLNAPLGMGLSLLGSSGTNPNNNNNNNNNNQQMGLLLDQMKLLEEQQQQGQPLNQRSRRPSMGGRSGGGAPRSTKSSGVNTPASMQEYLYGSSFRNNKLDTTNNTGNVGGGRSTAASSIKEGLLSTNTSMKHDNSSYHDVMSDVNSNRSNTTSNRTDGIILTTEDGIPVRGTWKTSPSSKRRSACCSRKKSICVFIFFLLIVAGGLAAILTLHVFRVQDKDNSTTTTTTTTEEEGSVVTGTDGQGDSPVANDDVATTSSTPTQLDYVEDPPIDIEGRCSPSNLPGSLSACYSACTRSACCYPDFRGTLCFNAACQKYKPYCDIVHDTWEGAMDGILPTPSANVVHMCLEVNAAKDNVGDGIVFTTEEGNTESSSSSMMTSSENSITRKKRLRAHTATHQERRQRMDTSIETASTGNNSREQVCQDQCKLARCCQAPVSMTGSSISTSGVHTNLYGEHIVTSCQEKNTEQCREYSKFCVYSNEQELMTSSSPSFTPQSSSTMSTSDVQMVDILNDASSDKADSLQASLTLNVSSLEGQGNDDDEYTLAPTSSPRPTLSPTSSINPTSSALPSTSPSPTPKPLLPAPSLEIAEYCSGESNKEMILAGILAARTQCINVCQNGLCCHPEKYGYSSWMSSCYEGNEDVCLEYSPCLILAGEQPSVSSPSGNATLTEESSDSINNTVVTEDDNIDADSNSSENNTATVSSSGNKDTENSTIIENSNLVLEGPPRPNVPNDLTLLCSTDLISTDAGQEECKQACLGGACCLPGERSCYDTYPETCDLYQPCILFDGDLPSLPTGENEDGSGDENAVNEVSQDNTTITTVTEVEEDQVLPILEEAASQENVTVAELPPEAPSTLPSVCQYESLKSSKIARQECFKLCQLGKESCEDERVYESEATMEMFNSICIAYQPCASLYLLTPIPTTIKEAAVADIIELPDATPDIDSFCEVSDVMCKLLCEPASCCFEEPLSCINNNKDECEGFSPCAKHFQNKNETIITIT